MASSIMYHMVYAQRRKEGKGKVRVVVPPFVCCCDFFVAGHGM